MATKPIIVPLDGSAVAETALQAAQGLARAQDHEILVVTVEDAIVMRGFAAFAESEHITADTACARYLERVVRETEAGGVSARSRRIAGDNAAVAILDAAAEENAEMIVIATHGRSGVGKWLLGSVAEKVVRGATCPVLVVPADR
jgi:nucleotide-binding universal stress UspA family protein